MDKQMYHELQRLRRQEESFIFTMLALGRKNATPRELHELGVFGNISKNRFHYILRKFADLNIYHYISNIDYGKPNIPKTDENDGEMTQIWPYLYIK